MINNIYLPIFFIFVMPQGKGLMKFFRSLFKRI